MLFKNQDIKILSDTELVLLYKKKQSSRVIGEIYNRYGHLMLGLCLKYLKSEVKAEDMVMEIFEKLPKLIVKYDIVYFKSWLYTTTKNECLMLLRKKQHHFKEINDDLLSSEEELEDKLFLEVKISRLEEEIEELKDNQKQALKLFYLQGKSYQEISNIMKIDLKKVKSDVQNGKRNLKIKLQEDVLFKSAQ